MEFRELIALGAIAVGNDLAERPRTSLVPVVKRSSGAAVSMLKLRPSLGVMTLKRLRIRKNRLVFVSCSCFVVLVLVIASLRSCQ